LAASGYGSGGSGGGGVGVSSLPRHSKLAPIASCETIEGYSSDTDQSTDAKNEEETNDKDATDSRRHQESIKSEPNESKNVEATVSALSHDNQNSFSMPTMKIAIEKTNKIESPTSSIKLRVIDTDTAASINRLVQLVDINTNSSKEQNSNDKQIKEIKEESFRQNEAKFKDLARELESGKEMDSSNSSLSLSESISSASSLSVCSRSTSRSISYFYCNNMIILIIVVSLFSNGKS
jgi:hypothetical protein